MRDCHVRTCFHCLLVAFHLALPLSSILSKGSDSVLNSVLWFTQWCWDQDSIVSSLNTSDSELTAHGGAESSDLQFIMT